MALSRLSYIFARDLARNARSKSTRNGLPSCQRRIAVISRCTGNCHQNIRFASTERKSLNVTVSGVTFHCEKTGNGDHTVLLLPGAVGCSKTDFDPQLEKMNKVKFTIYAFDPRGYGKSIPPERDWPLEYLQRDAEDAVAVMKTLGEKNFSVLGWCDGGITGMIMAGRYPDLVRKLIIWGSNSFITENDMERIRAVEDIDKLSAKMKQPLIDLYGEEYFRNAWSNFVKAFSNYYTQRNGDICNSDLKNISCPTFIIHGDKDPMLDTVHPDYLVKHVKNSRLHRMPEGKHNIHLRYADEFNKMVEDFLDE